MWAIQFALKMAFVNCHLYLSIKFWHLTLVSRLSRFEDGICKLSLVFEHKVLAFDTCITFVTSIEFVLNLSSVFEHKVKDIKNEVKLAFGA